MHPLTALGIRVWNVLIAINYMGINPFHLPQRRYMIFLFNFELNNYLNEIFDKWVKNINGRVAVNMLISILLIEMSPNFLFTL